MSPSTRIQDLSPAEISAALEASDVDLSFEELIEVEDFVERIGGLSNARLAVEMLGRLEDSE